MATLNFGMRFLYLAAIAVILGPIWPTQAQTAAAGQTTTPAAPAPLATPPVTGPLQMAPPTIFHAGPFGEIAVDGTFSGAGFAQANPNAGDASTRATISNGQVYLQKTSGWLQFYVQGGVYSLPVLGTPVLSTSDTISQLYGPVPVGYLKITPSKNFSILIGALPTLIGAEYTFTFENMNIERGLLWNQENAINRGVQLNDTFGHFSASVSWNDGFYSNRFTWLTGSLAYTFNTANVLTFAGGGNLGHTAFRDAATPVQNDGRIYDIIYAYTKGPWIVQPYFQYTDIPTDRGIGIAAGASTRSGALLASYNFQHHSSLAARAEYISSTKSAGSYTVNLLFGPGSGGWSFTVTPTFQDGGFFIRGEFSLVRATGFTPGDAFGPLGLNRSQPRGALEAGLIF